MNPTQANWLRYLGLLALALWVGGIFFFSIGVAPVAFHIMPSQQAGELVRGSLRILHILGLVCGAAFLVMFFVQPSNTKRQAQALVACMMLLTAFSQWMVTPRIEEMRRSRDVQSPRFSRLHSASTGLEGAVLVLGLVALWKSARETNG